MTKLFTAIFYYLIIIPVSLLPFRLLYVLSDGLYFLLFRVFKYRKKVVISNLTASFPEKSKAEIEHIAGLFYRHLADMMVESFKLFTISESEIKQRMTYVPNEDIMADYHAGRSVIIGGGHFNNWELFAVAIDSFIPHHTVAIYTPLTNQFFDKTMKQTRGRFGLEMIGTKKIKNYLIESKDIIKAVIFGYDQSPGNKHTGIWMPFLNQPTLVQFGTEKTAKEYNYPVYYGIIRKVKRGHYQFELVKVFDQPVDEPAGNILFTLMQMLEKDIIDQPQYWLWSHKRWKHNPADSQASVYEPTATH